MGLREANGGGTTALARGFCRQGPAQPGAVCTADRRHRSVPNTRAQVVPQGRGGGTIQVTSELIKTDDSVTYSHVALLSKKHRERARTTRYAGALRGPASRNQRTTATATRGASEACTIGRTATRVCVVEDSGSGRTPSSGADREVRQAQRDTE